MTELEACVLAVVCQQGPITAYQLRKRFERSPTSSWRASTGSIYPLIKRLHRQGLVRMSEVPADGRGTKLLVASEAGRARVREWLTVLPPWIGDPTEDPIRTRLLFLDLMEPDVGSAAVAEMLQVTCAAIAAMDEAIASADTSPLERIGREGARAMLVARRDWLVRVQEHLAHDYPAAGEARSAMTRKDSGR
jgi:DNA-binding PadR family transcriptional regulator